LFILSWTVLIGVNQIIAPALFDAPFALQLDALRRRWFAVVVSASNAADLRPLYPAAFAPRLDWSHTPPTPVPPSTLPADDPPVLTVAATNPNGTTALFSNDGPWVTCRRPGAGIVSTMPTTMAGSRGPSTELAGRHPGERRATIDPDDFTGGFGVWSGTSFAAPVLAGEIAAELLAQRAGGGGASGGGPGTATVPERCKETWKAITATTGLEPDA